MSLFEVVGIVAVAAATIPIHVGATIKIVNDFNSLTTL